VDAAAVGRGPWIALLLMRIADSAAVAVQMLYCCVMMGCNGMGSHAGIALNASFFDCTAVGCILLCRTQHLFENLTK
jgi:hypothetical protein